MKIRSEQITRKFKTAMANRLASRPISRDAIAITRPPVKRGNAGVGDQLDRRARRDDRELVLPGHRDDSASLTHYEEG